MTPQSERLSIKDILVRPDGGYGLTWFVVRHDQGVAIGYTCISVPGPVTETKDKNIINFIFSRLEH